MAEQTPPNTPDLEPDKKSTSQQEAIQDSPVAEPPVSTAEQTPEWLEKLQNESWQAEILISGGTFVGLLSAFVGISPLLYYIKYSTNLSNMVQLFILFIILYGLIFLIAGFFIHLVSRGFWVGLIGLNYVYPNGISSSRLKFEGKFRSLFKESSNTSLILRIDKFCGVIFAITFLFLFSILAFALYAVILISITERASELVAGHSKWFVRPIVFLLIAIGLITFIDFITGSRLKKIKWFARIYYPIHYFVSLITLSFIYRRLYYTFLSNIKSRYFFLGFVLLQISLMLLPALLTNHTGLSSSLSNSASGLHYLENKEFLSLKSETVDGSILEFSIIHEVNLEGEVFKKWKLTHPDSTKIDNFEQIEPHEQIRALGNLYQVYIDGRIDSTVHWQLHVGEDQSGLFPFNDLIGNTTVSSLAEGSHQLAIKINVEPAPKFGVNNHDGYEAKINFTIRRNR